MKAPARLILVRHAETDCSVDGAMLLCGSHDVHLSPAGRAQVERLRHRLASETDAAALYCSPLRRAMETAQAAPPHLLQRLRVLKSLAEIHCGEVEGMPLREVRQTFPEQWSLNEAQQDENFGWPGGETYRRFHARVLRIVKRIACAHPGQKVVLVTHAGVVNQILGTISGQSAARWENFRPGNTGITEVLWSGDTGEVIRFNDRSHLNPIADSL